MRASLVLLVLILPVCASPAGASFPGRNGALAFSAYSVNEESTDILVEDEFVGIARIPKGPRHIFATGSSPAFSPNGRQLAYVRSHDYVDRRVWGIWLARPDCRWPRNRPSPSPCSRVRHLTRGMDDSPAWSPNGMSIAFVRRDSSIYRVHTDGGRLRFLVRGSDPDWSSKGALAFTEPDGRGIRVREPGGRIHTVMPTGSQPSWAPSGSRLAFTGQDETTGRPVLYTIGADGTGLRKLWQSRDRNNPYAGPLSPTWSPNGQWIAFVKDFGGGFTGAVYAVRPNGRSLRVLTPSLPNCRSCFKGLNFDTLAWQALR